MARRFYYVAAGKMYRYENGADEEIGSGILNSYIRKVKDSAERTEWKYNGSGAAFTGNYRPGSSAEDRVSAIRSQINCVGEHNGDLIYSIDIDSTNGIYRRNPEDRENEGIVLCSSSVGYREFDIVDNLMVTSAYFAGESHIAIMDLSTKGYNTYTEGRTKDFSPVWSRARKGSVLFCSAGLPEGQEFREESDEEPRGLSQMVSEMYSRAADEVLGPTSIAELDVFGGTLRDVLADDKYDFTHPQSMPDGSLYYIRKPYKQNTSGTGFGCLGDIIMLPVRLIYAIFGFLNVFSAKYSGKTLSSREVKGRDERQTFIDGNLINAERELKENKRKGDKNPGIIPHSWELHRRMPDGSDVLIKKGVLAYRADEDGTLLISNGSHILSIDGEGKEERILNAPSVTFIK